MSSPMRVVHITPTYFDRMSLVGGGERYTSDLASHMARVTDTTLVSFADERRSFRRGQLRVELYPARTFFHGNRINPCSLRYLGSIARADVVHLHHIHTFISDVAALIGAAMRRRMFVTDYGGGAGFKLNHRLPVLGRYHGAIAYSSFGRDRLPAMLRDDAALIKGGLDTERFCPDPAVRRRQVILFVGRMLPHKGVNYLIEAFRELERSDCQLRLVGPRQHPAYEADLRRLARGLPVEFVHDADDERLLAEYRAARVTVLPSVHTTMYGDYTPVPELMGLTLLESQACGTPVVCTTAGAMPEFVIDGVTGCVAPESSAGGLATALTRILELPDSAYRAMSRRARELAVGFSWDRVVPEHLAVYRAAL